LLIGIADQKIKNKSMYYLTTHVSLLISFLK
jgi:hypothetical protein